VRIAPPPHLTAAAERALARTPPSYLTGAAAEREIRERERERERVALL
jgi:hypothetical protein